MAESEKINVTQSVDLLTTGATNPLVFISHDSRDSELAEAFGKLLKSVSAGMIRTFRSSDKKGTEGIDFGEEWYKRLMTQLQSTSDVICLFTERSLDRPWILFEAGVAKGKLNTPVIGVALGVPLSRISSGPFYQFMNMDDSESDLTKLVNQLAKRIPNLELDSDVVKTQVAAFKFTEASVLKKLASKTPKEQIIEDVDVTALVKLAEEMKALPSRVAERVEEGIDPIKRRRLRRIHPLMIDEILQMSGDSRDPVAILMVASLIRDDMPWIYELALDVYRAIKIGNTETIEIEIERFQRFVKLTMQGPFMDKESFMLMKDFSIMFENIEKRFLNKKLQTHNQGRTFKSRQGSKTAE